MARCSDGSSSLLTTRICNTAGFRGRHRHTLIRCRPLSCTFGHETGAGQNRCPVCGERLVIIVQEHAEKNGSATDADEQTDDDRDEPSDDRPEDP
jgi:hypothetical protein